jgi:glycosyltransferase involved in cell wall biosynthesis
MRIMIVTDQYPPMVGGVPKVTRDLATNFARRGHDVVVVAPSYGTRDVHRVEDQVHIYRFSSFEWPTYVELRIPFLPFLSFRRLLKQYDPEIIHIHSPVVMGNIAQILAGGQRKPVIATNHYMPTNIGRSIGFDPILGKSFQNVWYSYLVHFCNRCEYVTAPTVTALNLLYEHGLRAPARAISNGIDLARYQPGQPNEEVRQRFQLPADRPLILSVNRLSHEKRIDVLIDAAAKLHEQAHIVITSTGPAEAELRAQVGALNLQDRVTFPGFVSDEDLISLYRLADIFTIPSEADLQSLATMEAMAVGLPVVAARAYALPELVHHEENGFLFSPGNSDEMAHYLDILLRDSQIRKSMGARSLEIVAGHDSTIILDQWETLYLRLITEFAEARKRKGKRGLPMARKLAGFARDATHATRGRNAIQGDLALDKGQVTEE